MRQTGIEYKGAIYFIREYGVEVQLQNETIVVESESEAQSIIDDERSK